MDEQKISSAHRGQKIKEVTALDRSSVGVKGQSSMGEAEGTFKGGLDYLGHSLKGVSAEQEGNGSANPGKKGTVKY